MESVLRVKLSPKANEEDLSALFSGYSHSVSKVVIERGYGMVYFTSKAVAEEALARLDGTEMLGSKIQVCFHRGRQISGVTKSFSAFDLDVFTGRGFQGVN